MKTIYPHISLRQFAFTYEDLPAFHAAYFMLILIFAGIFDLGFFGVLILVHILLDFVKYRRVLRASRMTAVSAVLRESLADIALFFLALSSIVYLHPTLPSIAAILGGKQTHVIIMRGLAVLLPKLSILHHSLRMVFNAKEYVRTPYARLQTSLSLAECIYLSTLFLSLCFLAIAPGVLGIDLTQFKEILLEQLVPWKF
jgi:hypothetical protein